MKAFLMTFLLMPAAVSAAQSFLVFPTEAAYRDPAIAPVIKAHFSQIDYLGPLAILPPELNSTVPPQHRVTISPNLAELRQNAQMGCDSQTPGILFYQWGQSPHTPAGELADPIGSARQAATMVHSGCYRFGFLPDAQFFGGTQCAYDLQKSLHTQIDWTTIDYLDIQGEGLLSDECIGVSGIKDYLKFAGAIATYVRSKNPRIVITAQLSFRNTPPPTMVEAVHELSGIVDGFLLSYPLNPAMEHKYCDVGNLSAFLSTLRPGVVQ